MYGKTLLLNINVKNLDLLFLDHRAWALRLRCIVNQNSIWSSKSLARKGGQNAKLHILCTGKLLFWIKMSSILIFLFTDCLKITQTLKVTDVRIKSFRNNSLVTDNSLYRLSSRNSEAFLKSALTGLWEISSTVPTFEIGPFYTLTFAGNRCGNVLFSLLLSIPLKNDE